MIQLLLIVTGYWQVHIQCMHVLQIKTTFTLKLPNRK